MPSIEAEPYSDDALAKLIKLFKSRGTGYIEKRLLATIVARDNVIASMQYEIDVLKGTQDD